ncbi:hypothetical protein [Streptomyces sp. NPDC048385]|uniref:hypothetical protein n=1 Tax=unclassified Streptomyces TaxID=2593676 RepID=UPI0034377D45
MPVRSQTPRPLAGGPGRTKPGRPAPQHAPAVVAGTVAAAAGHVRDALGGRPAGRRGTEREV